MLRLFASLSRKAQYIATLIISSTLSLAPVLNAAAQATPHQPTATVITVDTSTDLNPTSLSQTCAWLPPRSLSERMAKQVFGHGTQGVPAPMNTYFTVADDQKSVFILKIRVPNCCCWFSPTGC